MFMNLMPKTHTALAGVLVVMSMVLTGCVTTVGTKAYYHHPPHVWYDYYYYPTLDIYLEIDSGYYWHRSHDHWVRVKRLPPQFHTHGHKRVFLRLDVDQPYRNHKEHYKRYYPRQHEGSDARKETSKHASDDQRDTYQIKWHNQRRAEDNVHVSRQSQPRRDDKSQGIRPELKRRGAVRDDIPQHNVNRPVDARLKQKRAQQRSNEKNLQGNGPRQSRRSADRKDISKPALEDRKGRHRSHKENRRRADEKSSVIMKNTGSLPAYTEQWQ